ncbi:MAG: GNAT family N-acetyltransferase [Bdellovibrionaceae bacterium]|nr:GNAT family N-acetyltransferase [Bdellovibrionales bacterium]MCB9254569.1 GNAT family N-acetyltransferase [Pseudobdellovibrionaceae bacterium]
MRTVCYAVSPEISLTEIRRGDKPAFLEYLVEKEIYDFTLAIPHPYKEDDADEWIRLNEERLEREAPITTFAIRQGDRLIGCCGFLEAQGPMKHTSEIGYWIGKPHWGKGIMSQVVSKLCEIGFKELGFFRLTAHIFSHNGRSERVLVKNRFKQEGVLRSHYLKDGEYRDAKIFARLKTD